MSGDFHGSDVLLNDFWLIEELRLACEQDRSLPPFDDGTKRKAELLQQALRNLGAECADFFRQWLPLALAQYRQIYVLMHVPPFRQACWHQGRISDDNWAPHFVCAQAGMVLRELMEQHPDRRMTVLCGHTHGAGFAQILPNLEVRTGGAEYGHPKIQRSFTLDLRP